MTTPKSVFFTRGPPPPSAPSPSYPTSSTPSRSRPPPKPKTPQFLALGLPKTLPSSPATVLASSVRHITTARATAAREKVVTAANYGEYLPLATACLAIAAGLARRGKPMSAAPFVWRSALGVRATEVRGGFEVEVMYVIFCRALVVLRHALMKEGRTALGRNAEEEVVEASKMLQAAAAQFRYVATVAAPRAAAAVGGAPTAEMDAGVSHAMADLCLALAQCLLARSAELSRLPAARIVELVLGARCMCDRAVVSAGRCVGVLTPTVGGAGRDLGHFCRAWAQRLLAWQADAAGRFEEKTGRMRLAVQIMGEIADWGGVVGVLAGEEFRRDEGVFRDFLDDAQSCCEPETDVGMLGLGEMETKILVVEKVYEPPVAQTVK